MCVVVEVGEVRFELSHWVTDILKLKLDRTERKDVEVLRIALLISKLRKPRTNQLELRLLRFPFRLFFSLIVVFFSIFTASYASPSQVKAAALSSTVITVEWSPIPLDKISGTLLGYKVVCMEEHTGTVTQRTAFR